MEVEEQGVLERSLAEYIHLLENEAFFDAHEVLEEAWHPYRKRRDPLSDPLKGLINAAVAFEHIKRGRPDAARKARSTMLSFDRRCIGKRASVERVQLFAQARDKVLELKKRYGEVFDVLVP